MSTELRKKVKNDFGKEIFKLVNNAVFQKIVRNVKKHRDMKIVRTETSRNYLMSKANYHRAKCFSENYLTIEMKKNKQKNPTNIHQ